MDQTTTHKHKHSGYKHAKYAERNKRSIMDIAIIGWNDVMQLRSNAKHMFLRYHATYEKKMDGIGNSKKKNPEMERFFFFFFSNNL